jgi:hemoglobin
MEKREIKSMDDTRFMVDSFYENVRKDELIGPIFHERIGNTWPEHPEKMYRFWQNLLLDEHTYHGVPFAPRATMPVFEEHFARRLQLFGENLNRHLMGEVAEEALKRAANIIRIFHSKRETIRKIEQQESGL